MQQKMVNIYINRIFLSPFGKKMFYMKRWRLKKHFFSQCVEKKNDFKEIIYFL